MPDTDIMRYGHSHRTATEDDFPIISSIDDAEHILGIQIPRDPKFYKQDGKTSHSAGFKRVEKVLSKYENGNPKIVSNFEFLKFVFVKAKNVHYLEIILYEDERFPQRILTVRMDTDFKVLSVKYEQLSQYLPEYGKYDTRNDHIYYLGDKINDWHSVYTYEDRKIDEIITMPQSTEITQEILDQYWQKRGGRPTLA